MISKSLGDASPRSASPRSPSARTELARRGGSVRRQENSSSRIEITKPTGATIAMLKRNRSLSKKIKNEFSPPRVSGVRLDARKARSRETLLKVILCLSFFFFTKKETLVQSASQRSRVSLLLTIVPSPRCFQKTFVFGFKSHQIFPPQLFGRNLIENQLHNKTLDEWTLKKLISHCSLEKRRSPKCRRVGNPEPADVFPRRQQTYQNVCKKRDKRRSPK